MIGGVERGRDFVALGLVQALSGGALGGGGRSEATGKARLD